VPGTARNAPNSQALPVYPQQTTPPQSAKSESGTYGASRTVRHVTAAPGHIRRLTAAVVVNDRMESAAGQKGQAANWQPRTAAELHTLTALAQAAVGFDAGRGDLVTVQDLAFDENRNAVSPSLLSQAMQTVEHSPVLVKYCALLVGLVLLILLAIRPALGRAKPPVLAQVKNKPAALAAPAEAQAALPTSEQAALEVEKQRVQRVFDQVTDTLKRDPAQSSRLLQSWIHSD
jgi:flagellar M-ring protein FliF